MKSLLCLTVALFVVLNAEAYSNSKFSTLKNIKEMMLKQEDMERKMGSLSKSVTDLKQDMKEVKEEQSKSDDVDMSDPIVQAAMKQARGMMESGEFSKMMSTALSADPSEIQHVATKVYGPDGKEVQQGSDMHKQVMSMFGDAGTQMQGGMMNAMRESNTATGGFMGSMFGGRGSSGSSRQSSFGKSYEEMYGNHNSGHGRQDSTRGNTYSRGNTGSASSGYGSGNTGRASGGSNSGGMMGMGSLMGMFGGGSTRLTVNGREVDTKGKTYFGH